MREVPLYKAAVLALTSLSLQEDLLGALKPKGGPLTLLRGARIDPGARESQFFIGNLLVRIHFIIEII